MPKMKEVLTKLGGLFVFLLIFTFLNTFFVSAEQQQNTTFLLSPLEVIPHTYYQMARACEPAHFLLEIKNPSPQKDAYLFSIPLFTNESLIIPQTVVLDPQQSHNVSITITPQDCSQKDRVHIPFHIETTRAEQAFEIPLTLDIDPEGVPLIARGITTIVTNYSENAVLLPILNPGINDTTFFVTLLGENWTTITPSPLIVRGNNASQVILTLKPSENISEGDYPLVLTLEDAASGKKYKKEIPLLLQHIPFQKKWLQRLSLSGYIFIILMILFLSGKTFIQWYYSPNAKHKRLVRAELRKQRITQLLAKQEERTKKTPSRTPQNTPEIPSTARRTSPPSNAAYVLVPKHSIVRLKTHSSKTFIYFLTWIVLLVIGTFLSSFLGGAILALLGVRTILRMFLVTKKFSLIIANEEAVIETRWKTSIRKVALLLNTPVKKAKITVKKLFSKPPQKQGPVFSYTSITSNIPSSLLKQASVQTALPVRWLAHHAASVEHIRIWRWSGKEWLEILPEITFRTARHIGIEFTADTLGIFALGIVLEKSQKKKATTKKNKENPGLVGYFALTTLLIIGVSLLTFILPQQNNETGVPRQVWPQDTEKTINISTYFHDPDGDTLHYTASPVKNIHVDIMNGFAILSPDQGFVGTREVVFTARDEKNATVSSNTIKLVVRKSYIPKQFRKYLLHNFIGLFLLALVFTLVRWKHAIKKFLEK